MTALKEDKLLTPEEVCYEAFKQAIKKLGPGATVRELVKRSNKLIPKKTAATEKYDYHDPWYCP